MWTVHNAMDAILIWTMHELIFLIKNEILGHPNLYNTVRILPRNEDMGVLENSVVADTDILMLLMSDFLLRDSDPEPPSLPDRLLQLKLLRHKQQSCNEDSSKIFCISWT